MHKIVIEEYFLLRELEDYFRTLTKGVSSGSLDKVLPKYWHMDAGRVADMDKQGIKRSILSCFNFGSFQPDPASARAVEMARRMNDILAERIKKCPDRFSGFAALPLRDAEALARNLL